jgi:NAD(P)-dependent dehydrogenase (short-subunit alcohol dehydrogenase family)
MQVTLEGKVALVTGASKGIGRAIAAGMAEAGASVMLSSRKLDQLEQAAAGIEGEVAVFPANAGQIDAAEACVAATIERFGRLDILVNNVGIGGGDGPAHRLEETAFDRILSVNLKGMWLTIKAALPVMRDQGGGSIVNISSLAARGGGIQLAYEVSKAGVNRLTTSVAQSNARYGVRCNAIMMGYMDTPMAVSGIASASGRPTAEVRAERDARVPLGGKMGTGWDTAYAALFLASDESKFISGAILPVDGAMGVRIG